MLPRPPKFIDTIIALDLIVSVTSENVSIVVQLVNSPVVPAISKRPAGRLITSPQTLLKYLSNLYRNHPQDLLAVGRCKRIGENILIINQISVAIRA